MKFVVGLFRNAELHVRNKCVELYELLKDYIKTKTIIYDENNLKIIFIS